MQTARTQRMAASLLFQCMATARQQADLCLATLTSVSSCWESPAGLWGQSIAPCSTQQEPSAGAGRQWTWNSAAGNLQSSPAKQKGEIQSAGSLFMEC